jgi:DNA-binding CsgD family transcriptional regulator
LSENEPLATGVSDSSLDLVLQMLQALAQAETADDFCKAMALEVLSDIGVVATHVGRLDSDGHLTMIGSYGYSQQRVQNTARPSIWENMAIAETVRTGKILIFNTWDDYMAKYPDKAHLASPGQAFVCLPLKMRGSRAGGFGIAFSRAINENIIDPKLWQIFTAAAEIFLIKGWNTEMQRNPMPGNQFGEDEKFVAKSLSDRERNVLRAIAQGKTNSQIAREFAYSESTIKQDTIRIFKILGVKKRADAVLAANTLGIIEG